MDFGSSDSLNYITKHRTLTLVILYVNHTLILVHVKEIVKMKPAGSGPGSDHEFSAVLLESSCY